MAAEQEGHKVVELPHLVTTTCGTSTPPPSWPGEEDRTRTVVDAVLGGLRTGCGQADLATKEDCRSSSLINDQAFFVSQKILSIWAM